MIIQALQEIEMHKTYFWTDSQSVLKYINNEDTRFHIFVASRIALIKERTNLNQWHYLPTAVLNHPLPIVEWIILAHFTSILRGPK